MIGPLGREAGERLRRTFGYNSGRVIGLTRLVLAAVFFLALWLDPDQPVRSTAFGYALLFSYLVYASVQLAISWRSWWWDHQLAWLAMVVDVSAFLSAVFFTEGAADDFTSPFLAFFAYLMLAATIRWDWRMTVMTGLAVTALYLLVGSYIATIATDFDIQRFGRRVIYMLVLSLVLAWFGLQRRGHVVERFVELPVDSGGRQLLDQALDYAIGQTRAGSAAIAWAEHEEPSVHLRAHGLEMPAEQLGPGEFDTEAGFSRDARLFDRPRKRCLTARRGERPIAGEGPVEDRFADLCGVDEGIALPLTGLTGRGELLLAAIAGMSADHLDLASLLGREIAAGFDRQATLRLSSEAALSRMRETLAGDLHDSVAQSLAGASLRLEGLRTWIRGGGDPEAEIDAMKTSLRDEQRHVRSLIDRLRLGSEREETVDAVASVRALIASLSVQWDVSLRGSLPASTIPVDASLAHEIGHLLREAVANAVRHGNATHVAVEVEVEGDRLNMIIEDDGDGFPAGDPGLHPWSISQRVDRLGGGLTVATGPDGTRLDIGVPNGSRA